MALIGAPGKVGRPLGLLQGLLRALCHCCRGKVAMGTVTQRANEKKNTMSVSGKRTFNLKYKISIDIDRKWNHQLVLMCQAWTPVFSSGHEPRRSRVQVGGPLAT